MARGQARPDKHAVSESDTAKPAARKRAPARAIGDGARTRGGWTPVGTAAERRAAHTQRGTARGERTRRLIVDAARRVFERDGYADVGVADIAREAGVAHGSFYTYFSSKLDVFRFITGEVAEVVDRAVASRAEGGPRADAVESLCRANARYVEAFRANARIYALMGELGHSDQELRDSLVERRTSHNQRVENLIRRWQAQGIADPAVDPALTAAALVAMIFNVCSWRFVVQDRREDSDAQQASETVNSIWIRAVDLRREPNPKWVDGPKAF